MSINNETRPMIDQGDIRFGQGLLTWMNEVTSLPTDLKNGSNVLVNRGKEAQVITGHGIDVYEKNLALHGIFLLKRSEAAPGQKFKSEELEQL